jgi:hypothetical protein
MFRQVFNVFEILSVFCFMEIAPQRCIKADIIDVQVRVLTQMTMRVELTRVTRCS